MEKRMNGAKTSRRHQWQRSRTAACSKKDIEIAAAAIAAKVTSAIAASQAFVTVKYGTVTTMEHETIIRQQ